MDVFVGEFIFTSFILGHRPKKMCYKFESKSKRLLLFSIDICHDSDISTEDRNIVFVAVKVNSEKSDYSWCNFDVWSGGFSDSKI